MNENGGKSSTILLTVIGIATLLVVVVGATFAYFAAVITGTETSTSVTIQTATDGTVVKFEGSNENNVTNIYPKATAWSTQPFSLSSDGGNTVDAGDVVYTFTLNYENGFTGNAAGIQYEVVQDTLTNATAKDFKTGKQVLPETGTSLTLGTVTAKRGAAFTASYVLKIYYIDNAGVNQNTNSEHTLKYHVSFASSDV